MAWFAWKKNERLDASIPIAWFANLFTGSVSTSCILEFFRPFNLAHLLKELLYTDSLKLYFS
jgi:hypothetical protein